MAETMRSTARSFYQNELSKCYWNLALDIRQRFIANICDPRFFRPTNDQDGPQAAPLTTSSWYRLLKNARDNYATWRDVYLDRVLNAEKKNTREEALKIVENVELSEFLNSNPSPNDLWRAFSCYVFIVETGNDGAISIGLPIPPHDWLMQTSSRYRDLAGGPLPLFRELFYFFDAPKAQAGAGSRTSTMDVLLGWREEKLQQHMPLRLLSPDSLGKPQWGLRGMKNLLVYDAGRLESSFEDWQVDIPVGNMEGIHIRIETPDLERPHEFDERLKRTAAIALLYTPVKGLLSEIFPKECFHGGAVHYGEGRSGGETPALVDLDAERACCHDERCAPLNEILEDMLGQTHAWEWIQNLDAAAESVAEDEKISSVRTFLHSVTGPIIGAEQLINAELKILQKAKLEKDLLEPFELAAANVADIARICRAASRLFQAKEVQNGKPALLTEKEVDPRKMVETAIHFQKERLEQKKIKLEKKICNEIPFIRLPEGDLELVVWQLIRNGVDHLSSYPENAPILRYSISWRGSDSHHGILEFEVSNSGRSVSKEERMKLIKRGRDFKMYPSKKSGGSGIGIASVYAVAQSQQKGKEWRIDIPLDTEEFTVRLEIPAEIVEVER